jgi:hypothetical protein
VLTESWPRLLNGIKVGSAEKPPHLICDRGEQMALALK